MRAEEQFDSFYLKTRRALVHQTFALTGDLAAAQRAVRDAYVAAWHHWRKVNAQDDPVTWVRPRAWAQAQRRHTTRLWHRTRHLSADDRAVLDALHKLPVAERRVLLMVELAGVPADVTARELSLTRETLRQLVQVARARFAAVLDIEPDAVRAPLVALEDAAARATLPRPAAVRREGSNRRRSRTVVAVAAATFLAVASGAFAHEPHEQPAAAEPSMTEPGGEPGDTVSAPTIPEPTLPSADDLLSVENVTRFAPNGAWKEVETHDNTGGDGINYVCQQQRFADAAGLGTLVRRMETTKGPAHSVVQAVEISGTRQQAAEAFETVKSWFATCDGGNLHLKRTYAVHGVADQARVLELASWSRPYTAYSVAFAQVGEVVTTSVVRAVDAPAPRTGAVARTLATAARMLCERAGDSDCGGRVRLQEIAPAPVEQAQGALATVDMPRLTGVEQPWVGTPTVPAPRNPASTSCDRADLRRAGAERIRTRTFLVPESRLPDRFGLTETFGRFATPRAAAGFMRTVRERFAGCEERDLATEVLVPRSLQIGRLNGSTWRLRTELSESREVIYDVGFVRRGNVVAQLTFVPAGPAQLGPGEFRALLVRAGQRLGELG